MGVGTRVIELVSERGGVRSSDSRATTPGRGLALEGDVELRQRGRGGAQPDVATGRNRGPRASQNFIILLENIF